MKVFLYSLHNYIPVAWFLSCIINIYFLFMSSQKEIASIFYECQYYPMVAHLLKCNIDLYIYIPNSNRVFTWHNNNINIGTPQNTKTKRGEKNWRPRVVGAYPPPYPCILANLCILHRFKGWTVCGHTLPIRKCMCYT